MPQVKANSEMLHVLRWPLIFLLQSPILTTWSVAGRSGLAAQSPTTHYEYPQTLFLFLCQKWHTSYFIYPRIFRVSLTANFSVHFNNTTAQWAKTRDIALFGSFDSFTATSKACIGIVWTLLRVQEVDSTLGTTWPYLCTFSKNVPAILPQSL